jgi:hypothetical protein
MRRRQLTKEQAIKANRFIPRRGELRHVGAKLRIPAGSS